MSTQQDSIRQLPTKSVCKHITEVVIDEQKNMVLTDEIINCVNLIIKEQKNLPLLTKHKLPVTHNLLIHGKPGNGKTMFAGCLAKLLDISFYTVSLSSVVCSHLGETAKNIDEIINYVLGFVKPAVIFIDEVDSISMSRSVSSGSTDAEMHRSLNTFLASFNKIPGHVIMICATNLLDKLDSAFVRRFDRIIEFCEPDLSAKKTFYEQLVKEHQLKLNAEDKAMLLLEESYSNMKRAFVNRAKEMVLNSVLF